MVGDKIVSHHMPIAKSIAMSDINQKLCYDPTGATDLSTVNIQKNN